MSALRPGQVVEIDEADYAYGVGRLRLRVTGVTPDLDPRWLRVTGVEIHWTGAEGAPRDVLVRVGAQLRTAPLPHAPRRE